MNEWNGIGRLIKDPEVRYTSGENPMAIATFIMAIDRPSKDKEHKQTDFPRIQVFGRMAETCEKYLKKGRLVGVSGRLQTGSYTNKDGNTIYTTDVAANRVEFLEWGKDKSDNKQAPKTAPEEQLIPQQAEEPEPTQMEMDPTDSFEAIDEDVPF